MDALALCCSYVDADEWAIKLFNKLHRQVVITCDSGILYSGKCVCNV